MSHPVADNPFRILGVFSNASTRELMANASRIKAFARVGRTMSLPYDAVCGLPVPVRTAESVDNALAAIQLPGDRLLHSLFWFHKADDTDYTALECVSSGDIESAMSLWQASASCSARVNMLVCGVLTRDAQSTASALDSLASAHCFEYCHSVDPTLSLTSEELIRLFVNECEECGVFARGELGNAAGVSDDFRQSTHGVSSENLVVRIENAIIESRGATDPEDLYPAAIKLMEETRGDLEALKSLSSADDTQYVIMADKVAVRILDLSVAFYNSHLTQDREALVLHKYVGSIVVNEDIRKRCDHEIAVLEENIRYAPVECIVEEYKMITQILSKASREESSIVCANRLINEATPVLAAMRAKVGPDNVTYLRSSGTVVQAALNKTIEEVNRAQTAQLFLSEDCYKRALKMAWNVVSRLGTFELDTESGYFSYYDKSRNDLVNLCYAADVDLRFSEERTRQRIFYLTGAMILFGILIFLSVRADAPWWYVPAIAIFPLFWVTNKIIKLIAGLLYRLTGHKEEFEGL